MRLYDVLLTALLNAALLACAPPLIAQQPIGSTSTLNPDLGNRNRQTVRHSPQTARQAPRTVELPFDAPVVTLYGVCNPAEKSESKDCVTVITRGKMDGIVALMARDAPRVSHSKMAIDYVRMLAASKLAVDRGLGNNTAAAAELRGQNQIAHLQELSKALYRQLEDAAANTPASEIQQYYREHLSEFDEGEVWRLSIPDITLSPEGKHFDPRVLKAELEGLHNLAASGYDFDQLQVQAYKDLGIKQTPPPAKLTMTRRSSMAQDQSVVFELKPGEVTPMIHSFTHFVTLKLVSKQTAPFESVLPEIKANLKSARFWQELQEAGKQVTAEFNLQYIGLASQPTLFSPQISTYSSGPAALSSIAQKRKRSR